LVHGIGIVTGIRTIKRAGRARALRR